MAHDPKVVEIMSRAISAHVFDRFAAAGTPGFTPDKRQEYIDLPLPSNEECMAAVLDALKANGYWVAPWEIECGPPSYFGHEVDPRAEWASIRDAYLERSEGKK